jgi:hypothetical protein
MLHRVSELGLKEKALGKPTYRWEDNIKMDLKGVGMKYVERINMAVARDRWRALVNTVMNLLVT